MKQSHMLKQNIYIKTLEQKLKQAKQMVDELLAENKKLTDKVNAEAK